MQSLRRCQSLVPISGMRISLWHEDHDTVLIGIGLGNDSLVGGGTRAYVTENCESVMARGITGRSEVKRIYTCTLDKI